MAGETPIYLEVGKTWTFACALDWPGWCRRGKGREAAIEELFRYIPRYRAVVGSSFKPGSVRVIVTRHGHVVWDSAACKPPPAPTARFKLGVPQLLVISWNRAARHPAGCAGALSPGEWGTFDAVAVSGGRSSPVRSFELLR